MGYTIRRIGSLAELDEALDVLGSQFDPPIRRSDRRFRLHPVFADNRPYMLVVEEEGRMVGGALAFAQDAGLALRVIALEPGARGKGLARRLVQTIEVEAMKRGIRSISLGAASEAKGFYARLGYHGRSSMHKELPLPGRVLQARLARLEPAVGDLDAGTSLTLDASGRVPALL